MWCEKDWALAHGYPPHKQGRTIGTVHRRCPAGRPTFHSPNNRSIPKAPGAGLEYQGALQLMVAPPMVVGQTVRPRYVSLHWPPNVRGPEYPWDTHTPPAGRGVKPTHVATRPLPARSGPGHTLPM